MLEATMLTESLEHTSSGIYFWQEISIKETRYLVLWTCARAWKSTKCLLNLVRHSELLASNDVYAYVYVYYYAYLYDYVYVYVYVYAYAYAYVYAYV